MGCYQFGISIHLAIAFSRNETSCLSREGRSFGGELGMDVMSEKSCKLWLEKKKSSLQRGKAYSGQRFAGVYASEIFILYMAVPKISSSFAGPEMSHKFLFFQVMMTYTQHLPWK